MSRNMFEPTYKKIFPFWEEISKEEKNYICDHSLALTYPKGTVIKDGDGCSGVIFVRSGCLRLYMLSDEGKEITLYRLHGGIPGRNALLWQPVQYPVCHKYR